MDDTTIITDADYGFVTGGTAATGVATAASQNGATITGTLIRQRQSALGSLYGTVAPVRGGANRIWVNERGELCSEYIPPEQLYADPSPPKPRKPSPSLPVEAWAAREFDAEQAHAATLALCRGNN